MGIMSTPSKDVQYLRCLRCLKIIKCSRYDTNSMVLHVQQDHPEIIESANAKVQNLQKLAAEHGISEERLSQISKMTGLSRTEMANEAERCKFQFWPPNVVLYFTDSFHLPYRFGKTQKFCKRFKPGRGLEESTRDRLQGHQSSSILSQLHRTLDTHRRLHLLPKLLHQPSSNNQKQCRVLCQHRLFGCLCGQLLALLLSALSHPDR